jgi:proteasome lid subunit RPN8/RPN11
MSRIGNKANLKIWGSPEDSNVVIYIDKQAYDAIHRHGAANPQREVVGILLGNFSEDSTGKYRVDIVGIVESDYATGDQTQAQFTHQVWLQLVESAQRKYPDQKVVGWYHTHPGFGAFMSDDDVNAHHVAFSHPWHVAAVCDPTKNELCFFGWDGSEIKAIKGFYTYKVPDKELKLLPPPRRKTLLKAKMPAFLIPVLVFFVALFVIIGLAFTVWLPGEQKSSQPPFENFPAAVVSFRNDDKAEVYNYYFTQNDSEVWRYTLNKEDPWDKEMPLPITLKEIMEQPAVNTQGNGVDTIGTLALQAEDEKGGLWLLSTDILTNGKLAGWQKTEISTTTPATGVSLSTSEKYLFFGTAIDTIALQLTFTGSGNLSWLISSKPDWVKVDKESGDGNSIIDVTAQRSELSPGDHSGKMLFSYDGNKKTEEVLAFVTIFSSTEPVSAGASFKIISVTDESNDGKISRGGEEILVVVQNTGRSSGEAEVSINSSEIFTILESPETEELKPGEEFTFAFRLKPNTMRSGISESLVFKVKNLTSTANEYDEESERFFAP